MAREWDRRDDEASSDYEAFQIYLKAGPRRTLKVVAEQLGLTAGRVSQISTANAWDFRADQYDGVAQALWARAQEERFEREAAVEAKIVSKAMATAAELVNRLHKQVRGLPKDAHVSLDGVREFMDTTLKLHRLVRGQTTENIGMSEVATAATERLTAMLDSRAAAKDKGTHVPTHKPGPAQGAGEGQGSES